MEHKNTQVCNSRPESASSPSSSPKADKTQEKPKAAFNLQPLDQSRRDELDQKYANIEHAGQFTCYFGKYKNVKTFGQIVNDDKSYTRFMCKVQPCTNNIYLFQKYVNKMHADVLKEPKKATSNVRQRLNKADVFINPPIVPYAEFVANQPQEPCLSNGLPWSTVPELKLKRAPKKTSG